ncbi:MAG TPA: MBL fold metallo-hydrolase [Pseudonocardiaceae bacterium]|jgi:glyoxylase-like metal-dependent hydrolase (beta-lactamase superfamily II)
MDDDYRIEMHDGWARFAHGDFTCTVVSDGILEMGPAHTNFPTADPADIAALLTEHHRPVDAVRLNQNPLIIDTGDRLVLIDSGVGTIPDLGVKSFGTHTGRTVPNMRAAGVDPADIDIVAITHGHPDHCWGLVDAAGKPLYPNATVMISRADFDHWTDLDKIPDAPSEHLADHYRGAHANLMPYRDAGQLVLLEDGSTVVPGITAIATPGHSPGHLVYEITSQGHTIICWGDLCHHDVLLLQRPDWSFQFDFDRSAATGQRKRIYDLAYRNRYAVFGYHFPFPGLGHLRRDGDGYGWLPVPIEPGRA